MPSCLLQYKSKISDEMDLKRRIQSLEESMDLHERMKRQALAEFESYRQRMEDMQLCTEAQVDKTKMCCCEFCSTCCGNDICNTVFVCTIEVKLEDGMMHHAVVQM